VSRNSLGGPNLWSVVFTWLIGSSPPIVTDCTTYNPKKLKHPYILPLDDYNLCPEAEFWTNFPANGLSKGPRTCIKKHRLAILIKKYSKNWDTFQKQVAKRALKILNNGAETVTMSYLPPIRAKNCQSAIIYGKFLTDTVADWVQKKYVAGPFDNPPLFNFRVNPLMAVAQPGKIRPILNLSAPLGRSLNEDIDESTIPKIFMTTARDFAFNLHEAGFYAKFSKFDLTDAYKIIPAHPASWRLHGFQWLGKFFVDTSTIFGSKSAPAHFDCIAQTIVNIAISKSKIQKKCVMRTLDDTPIVTPAGSKLNKSFCKSYSNICKFLHIQLAPFDNEKEKSFLDSCKGKVLGFNFDSTKQTWSLPKDKTTEMLALISLLFHAPATHLENVQKILGKWESLCLLSPFCKSFRWPIINFIKKFENNKNAILQIPSKVKDDLRIWHELVKAAIKGLPLIPRVCDPPLSVFTFVSDAAGKPPPNSKVKTGVASIGIRGNSVWFGCRLFWPLKFTLAVQNNTAVYELIGLIIPIIINRKIIRFNHVELKVDNQAIVWSWPKKQMKADELASILLRLLSILEMYIPCKIYVSHLPRLSTSAARCTDNLSRDSTSTKEDLQLLTHSAAHLPNSLLEWLDHPIADWSLPIKIINEISGKNTSVN